MVLEIVLNGEILLFGRILFGGMLAAMALPHFMKLDFYEEYASNKEVPMPKIAVLTSGGILLVGSTMILTGFATAIGAILLLIFFSVVTPEIHNFWDVEDPEQRQQEIFHFQKNVVMTGAVLMILAISIDSWPLGLEALIE